MSRSINSIAMARLSVAVLIATVLLCLDPVSCNLALFLRGQSEEKHVDSEKPETTLEASQPDNVPVSTEDTGVLHVANLF